MQGVIQLVGSSHPGVLLMDSSTLGQVEPGIEPPTFWFVDNLNEPLH